MAEPVCAQKGPYALELIPGDYWWCACGQSKAQPFCDGSHKGTGLSPMEYVAPRSKTVYFCGCKATDNKPLCDGAHGDL